MLDMRSVEHRLVHRRFLKTAIAVMTSMVMVFSLVGCTTGSDQPSGGGGAPEVIVGSSLPGEPLTQAEIDYYMTKIENNLTEERTGRAPEPTSFDRIRSFAEADDGKAFYMVNLVREHETPQYPSWWTGERAETVLDAKKLYSAACAPKMADAGSYSMFGVTYARDAVLTDDEDMVPWDQFYLISYPNRKAFLELLASDEYADAVIHKYAGDKDTQLIPVSAGTPAAQKEFTEGTPLTQEQVDDYMALYLKNLTPERTGHDLNMDTVRRIRNFLETDDGKPFLMINLVREYDAPTYPEWWTGERADTVLNAKKLYSLACAPIMAGTGSYSTLGVMTAQDAVVTDDESQEPWDQFYLIAYPNREAFMKLLASDPYADAIVHKYAGDKDTQLIPVTYAQLSNPYTQG